MHQWDGSPRPASSLHVLATPRTALSRDTQTISVCNKHFSLLLSRVSFFLRKKWRPTQHLNKRFAVFCGLSTSALRLDRNHRRFTTRPPVCFLNLSQTSQFLNSNLPFRKRPPRSQQVSTVHFNKLARSSLSLQFLLTIFYFPAPYCTEVVDSSNLYF